MSKDTMTPFRNAVRTFNKHVLNPVMLHFAGRKHWYASVVRHTGRTSGKPYATPVVAEKVDGGFLVPLPYGTGVDWLRNVLAAGRATVVSGGETHEVDDPEIIDLSEASLQLPANQRHVFERFGVEKFVKLRLAQKPSNANTGHAESK
ncbi:nitroreductase [Mycobacterium sp. 20091114027_K0903767]|uniref:nitroreductase n=1 Tax=Mycolicibacterium porcinum TaxID=39693 RepID=UPI00080B1E05|nr:nitroreductase [Mycolicibacterium porcinum]MBX8691215.1 nitroreductase [Mycobacterium sp. 20091114027_K0903767]OCB49751.1 nitroreductase [Mycolicibacterium vulneris]TVX97470.1 nitroreductase [Mycolicibacterium porcinum]